MPDPTTPTWRLVPAEPSREIVTAMIREAAFQDIALSVDAAIHIYREAMRASPAPQELPPVQLPEPVDWPSLYRRMKNVAAGYSNYCEESGTTRRLEREFEAIDAEARAAIAADRRAGGR